MDPAVMAKRMEANKVFTPTTPVDEADLFSGRSMQITRVIEVVAQRGQHSIIFGERGVGKTSLANVLAKFLSASGTQVLAPRATADGSDTFSSLWRKVFSEIIISNERNSIGFNSTNTFLQRSLSDQLPEEISPDAVRRILQHGRLRKPSGFGRLGVIPLR